MKKLSILLFTLFICAASFAQDTIDSSRVAFFRNSKTQWREVNNFSSGVVNDSIRGITIGSVKFERVDLRSTTFDAQELGIMADGTDQSAKIAYKLSKSFVKRVRFTNQGGSNFVISSALTIPAGVEVDVENGFTISATLNFNGNIVNADPTKVIFPTGGSYVRNIRTKDNYTPAIWFGAIGNGSTDNAAFLNNAQLAGVVGQKVLVSKAASFYQINSAFTQGVDFVSLDSAEIRYNPSASATGVTMWTISTNGAILKGLKLNGSKTLRRLIYVTPNIKNVKVTDNDLSNVNQVGSETSTVELLYFTQGNDSLYIARNYFHHADAKNDGVCRGIRGDYAGTAPANVIVEDNVFDEIHDTFAGSDDSDDICYQSYTTIGSWIIRRNKHKSIHKRGIKVMADGVKIYDEEFNSTRYSTASQRAYSAISIYANYVEVYNCRVNGGIFDNTIEIGANGQSYKNIWVNNVKCYTAYDASLITGADGFRWFGDLENVHVDDVFTQYNRYNYYIDATYRDLTINKATGNYSSSNSFTNVSGSVKWGDGLKITNCKAKKSGNSIAFDLWRVRNLTFTGNEQDSCGNGTPNTVTIRVDSLLGYTVCHSNTAIGTWTTQPNYGTWANRPSFSNLNAGKNWQYTASDRGDTLFIHLGGGNWVGVGGYEYTYPVPSKANGANVSGSGANYWTWYRIGKTVHGSGYVTISPSAANTRTVIRIAFPVAGSATLANQVSGGGSFDDGTDVGAVYGEGSASPSVEVSYTFKSASTSTHTLKVWVQYSLP